MGAAMLALTGSALAAQSVVRFDIAADLSAGDAGADIAGTSAMHYRCDSRVRISDRIWFERRATAADPWLRIEPDRVSYRPARFADPRRPGGRVRRETVQAPRSSLAAAGSGDFRLRSRMTFACAGHRIVARSETLPLPGIGA
ncbi:MAG: hypothetical protein QOE11_204 [Solirubrobacteraceae bacterium]|jgi:hypothetical protein|nr:hypothetical protein [Solirubrobacteraceae bacterium]